MKKGINGRSLVALALASALAVTGVAAPALAAPSQEMGEEPLAAQTSAPDLSAEVAVPMAEEGAPALESSSVADSLVAQATSLRAAGAKLTIQEVIYNRENPEKPSFTVAIGDKVLVEGKDYKTLAATENIGSYVYVQGIGEYAGTGYDSYLYERAKVAVPVSFLTVEDIPALAFTGKPVEPAVHAKFGEQEVAINEDEPKNWMNVKVAYHNNTKPGFGRVTISGSDEYQSVANGQTWATRFDGTRDIVFAIKGEAKSFPDVADGHWAKGVIGEATALGLFSGYKDGSFGPDDKVTRGQVATVLWSLSGKPEPGTGAKSFPDVKAKMYYTDAVAWAASAGVINGYKDGRFGPDDQITREQFATMVANYASKVAGVKAEGSADDYKAMRDAGSVTGWAQSSVGFCFRNKIISGTKDGRVNPQGSATRAESAKMIVFLHNMLSK